MILINGQRETLEVYDEAAITESICRVSEVRDPIRRHFGSALSRICSLEVSCVCFRIAKAEQAWKTGIGGRRRRNKP